MATKTNYLLVTARLYNHFDRCYYVNIFAVPKDIPWGQHIQYINSILNENCRVHEIIDRIETYKFSETVNMALSNLDMLIRLESIFEDDNAVITGNGYVLPLKNIFKLGGISNDN